MCLFLNGILTYLCLIDRIYADEISFTLGVAAVFLYCDIENRLLFIQFIMKILLYMTNIQLTSTDRQLLLYDIFRCCERVSYEEIVVRLPVGKKMIQCDIRTLTDAGLICVKYSRKMKAYIDSGKPPNWRLCNGNQRRKTSRYH